MRIHTVAFVAAACAVLGVAAGAVWYANTSHNQETTKVLPKTGAPRQPAAEPRRPAAPPGDNKDRARREAEGKRKADERRKRADERVRKPGARGGARGGTTQVSRYPAITAPNPIALNRIFLMQVSLKVRKGSDTADATPGPGGQVDKGKIKTQLPSDRKFWIIDATLAAPGFRILGDGKATRSFRLRRRGNSNRAVFVLIATPAAAKGGRAAIKVHLSFEGRRIATIARTFRILRTGAHGKIETVTEPKDVRLILVSSRAKE
jgi:hypothetical protein